MLANESIEASIAKWKGPGIGLPKHDVQTFCPICGDSQHGCVDITAYDRHTLLCSQTSDYPSAACQIQKSIPGFQGGAGEKEPCPWIEDDWYEEFFISLSHIPA